MSPIVKFSTRALTKTCVVTMLAVMLVPCTDWPRAGTFLETPRGGRT